MVVVIGALALVAPRERDVLVCSPLHKPTRHVVAEVGSARRSNRVEAGLVRPAGQAALRAHDGNAHIGGIPLSEPRLTSESQAMSARDHAKARQGCTPEHQLRGENESHRNGIVGQMAPRCQSDFQVPTIHRAKESTTRGGSRFIGTFALRPFPNGYVLRTVARERGAVPISPAFAEPHAGDLGHEVKLGRPRVPER